jgi:hypothetical protein
MYLFPIPDAHQASAAVTRPRSSNSTLQSLNAGRMQLFEPREFRPAIHEDIKVPATFFGPPALSSGA